jgi:hypothetical protein
MDCGRVKQFKTGQPLGFVLVVGSFENSMFKLTIRRRAEAFREFSK